MANTSILAAFERMWQHVVAAVGEKADTNHIHDDRYYTETEIDTKLSGKANSSHTHTKSEVGLGNVDNTADSAKSVKYATSAGSATSATKATQDASGNVITSTYETKTDATSKLAEAKSYADSAAATVKNDLLNNAGAAYDTLKELGDLIDDNKDAIDALEEIAAGKANATHTHAISDVTNLQSTLDGKAAKSHGTHVTYSTTAPVMDGTAAVGTASTVARSDHKHPTDTSRASKTEFDTHTADTTKHITATERTNWNAAKTHADSAHAPSNAQPNQNAFSNIAVSGQTTVAADSTTDTVTFAGSNVSITTDATNDKVTFTVADGSTSTKGVVKLENSTSSTSTTTAATPSSVKSAYDLANTAKTNAATAQTRADSAYTLAESKADSLSDLGITATATELNYVDGVTSNVQTQLDTLTSNKVSKTGDTMTGDLTIKANFGSVRFNDADGNKMSVLQANNDSHTTRIYAYPTDSSTYYERYDFPTPNTGLTSNKVYEVLTTKDVTASVAELNYVDGVTSNIQTQLNGKLSTSGTAAKATADASGNTITSTYMTKASPTGTGSLSLNRKSGTTVGANSVATGINPTATGDASHAEGYTTTASGTYSHAEGSVTVASGIDSHAEGYGTIAAGDYQHAQGKYNVEDTSSTYAHILGNGDGSTDRSNAHTIDWDGNAWFSGNVYVGGSSQSDATALATTALATTAKAGLMSATDKTKIDYANIAYGTCSTAAATTAKVVDVSGNTNWALKSGSIIAVKFSVANTASSPTLNVNETGARNIYHNGAAITSEVINAGDIATFIYDGSRYQLIAVDKTNINYTATITTTWSGSAAPYSQNITVTGITANDKPIVDVTMSGTYATDQARLADWGKIYRIVTAANKITVYATAKTSVALPIQLQVVR